MSKNYKKFLENKERRDALITEVTSAINTYLESKGSKKRYKAEDLIKRADNSKRVDEFKKCNEYFEFNKKQKDYATDLAEKYNIKIAKGFNRHYGYDLTIPKEGDNVEEIEKKNVELLKKYTEENKISTIKTDLINCFTMDKTKFFPKDIEEAFKTIEENKILYKTAFVISTEISNNGIKVSKEFEENGYDYYVSTIEQASVIEEYIQRGAAEFNLIMPDDLSGEDVTVLSAFLTPIINKYKDILDPGISYADYMTATIMADNEKGLRDNYKKFFKEHDKDHMFMINHTVGGTKFKDEIEKGNFDIKPGKPMIVTGIIDGIISNTQTSLRDVGTLSELHAKSISSEFDFNKEAEDLFILKEGQVSASNIAKLGAFVALANTDKDKYKDFLSRVDNDLIKKNAINKKLLDNYVDFFEKGYDYKGIENITEKGIEFREFKPINSSDPNIVYLNKIYPLIMKGNTLVRNPFDRHYDKDQADRIIESVNLKSDFDFFKEKARVELGLNEGITNEDLYKALIFGEKKLPEKFFESVEKDKETQRIDYLDKANLKKLEEINKEETKQIESIKEGLESVRYEHSQNLMKLEDPFERASLSNTNIDPLRKLCKENPKYIKSFDNLDNDNPTFLIERDHENTKEFANSKFAISKNTKDSILKIANKMKELKIFDKDNIDEQLRDSGEQGRKVYGYQKFNSKRAELIKAVDEGNLGKAYKISTEVKKIKGEYKELFSLIENTFPQDGKHIPGNLSTLRNSAIPLSLSENVQAQSQMNGIYNLLVLCDKMNIELEDFLNEPDKTLRSMIKTKQTNELKRINEGSLGKRMREMLMIPPMSEGNMLIARGFEILAALEKDDNRTYENSKSLLYFTMAITGDELGKGRIFERQIGENYYDVELDYEALRDFMALPDNGDVTRFMNNAVDYSTGEYFKKDYDYKKFVKEDKRTSKEIYDSVMEKLVALQESIFEPFEGNPSQKANENYISGALLYFNDVLKERGTDPIRDVNLLKIKSFIDDPKRAILNSMKEKDGLTYSYNEFARTVEYKDAYPLADRALESVKDKLDYYNEHYRGIDKEGVEREINDLDQQSTSDLRDRFIQNKESYRDHIKENTLLTLAISERYESRTFFGKIFRPAAWKERAIMKENRELALANGFSEEAYDDIFNYERDENVNNNIAKLIGSVENKNLQAFIESSNGVVETNVEKKLVNVKELDDDLVIDTSSKKKELVREESKELDVSNEIDLD